MILRPAPDRRPPNGPQYAHLPANLDLKAITRPGWAYYAAWVVSAVVFRRSLDRTADETTFVPLGSEYVNEHIPAKVRKLLLADLRQNGVLDCDDHYYFTPYLPGQPGKCLCYRLGERYRDQPVRPHPLTHMELLRKMAIAYQQERQSVTDPTHLALRAWNDQVEVLPQAPKDEHPFLDKMIRGEPRFTDCSQGRVHTNVTNLPAQYRQYLRLVGRELDAVDICTSQPLILGLLLTGRTRYHGKRGRRGEGEDTRPC